LLDGDGIRVAVAQQYPHRTEPIGTVREIYDGVLTPEMAVNTFRNITGLFRREGFRPVRDRCRCRGQPVSLTDVHFTTGANSLFSSPISSSTESRRIPHLQDCAVKLGVIGSETRTGRGWMSMSIAKSITSTHRRAASKTDSSAACPIP